MARLRAPAQRFLADRRAVSAVEFALIIPFVLLLMVAGLQLVQYTIAVRKVDLVARSISEMISQTAPPKGSTVATVDSIDLHFAFDSSMVLFPFMLGDAKRHGEAWYQNIVIDFASIAFKAKDANCAAGSDPSTCYVATVVWTSAGTAGGNERPCTVPQTPTADTAAPTPQSLPRSVFGPDSIIAVDVVFRYRPIFSGFINPLRITRSVFLQPRYASLVNYDTTNDDGIAVKCPGY